MTEKNRTVLGSLQMIQFNQNTKTDDTEQLLTFFGENVMNFQKH